MMNTFYSDKQLILLEYQIEVLFSIPFGLLYLNAKVLLLASILLIVHANQLHHPLAKVKIVWSEKHDSGIKSNISQKQNILYLYGHIFYLLV